MAGLGAQTLKCTRFQSLGRVRARDQDVGRWQGDTDRGPSLPSKELRAFKKSRGISPGVTMRSNKDSQPLHMVAERKETPQTELLRKRGGLREVSLHTKLEGGGNSQRRR